MYKGNISDTRWKEKPEVNRANHSLSLKAMHKEIAWHFRCHHTVMYDFRPLYLFFDVDGVMKSVHFGAPK